MELIVFQFMINIWLMAIVFKFKYLLMKTVFKFIINI